MRSIFLTIIFMFTLNLNASILTKELGAKDIAGVKLANRATLSYKSQVINLEPVAAALRAKKVILVNVNVYVGEIFKSAGTVVDKAAGNVVSSLMQQSACAVQLTFLRDVDAEKVMHSFKEALEKNKADLTAAGIKSVLDKVSQGGEVKKGQTLTFVIQKNGDNNHTLAFENNKGDVVEISGSDNVKSILLMWFGETADSGVQKFKEDLLK